MSIKVFRYGIIVIIVLPALLYSIQASGQSDNISIPYSCSFEDTAENANWVINAGPDGGKCHDQWYISSATAYDGHNSLYISNDGGVNPSFGVKRPNVVVAYRPIELPVGAYNISFDWKNLATDGSGMYVCIVTANDDSVSNTYSGAVPTWVDNTKQQVTLADGTRTNGALRGHQGWNNASFQYATLTPGRRVKLAFVWVNDNTDSLSNPLAACVDNIQITSNRCPKPENFTVASSCDSILLTWEGYSSSYELEYRIRGSKYWRKVTVAENKYILKGMQEGGYDFRVRGICYQDTSAYVSNYTAVVFCPENHCINYVELSRKNGVKCYIGDAGHDNFVETMADFGADDRASRHTVHWGVNQYDPRTDYQLSTVPPGAVASVRLGNWRTGSEAERIEYEFTVDSMSNILLLKYAVVLQDPDGHTPEQRPQFMLEILGEDGKPIDADCGGAEFYADRTRPGWNNVQPGSNEDATVTWKDWTTLGLNLNDHIGETLTIRLTTQDCTESGHYGYAYLTLDCTEGEIKNTSCGDDPEMELAAPEGFNYSWTNSDDPSFHSDKQTISVPATDVSTYYCVCSFTENEDCSFELSTVVEPRFPKAEFSYELARRECTNVVKFTNKSHIIARIGGEDVETDEPCEGYIWEFADLGQSLENEPEFIFPDEGGAFGVRLISTMSDGNCVDDTTVIVEVPPVTAYLDTIMDTICSGESYVFCGQYRMSSDTVVCVKQDINGCDSTTVLYLTVLPPIEDREIYDTVCFGESYAFGDGTYTGSGDYENWIVNGKGCRSVEVLHLTVRDEITFSCSHTDVIDSPNSGSITISGAPEGYTYTLNGEYGAPLSGLAGGEYTVVVYDTAGCASAPQTVLIGQNCLDLSMDEAAPVCADEKICRIGITVSSGKSAKYTVNYGEKATGAGFRDTTMTLGSMFVELILPEACRPDVYDADVVFHDEICGDTVLPVTLQVHYPSDIVRQKWNNVLAVSNDAYNGGYLFAAFQWYRNDMPLTGEARSYIYLGEETAFDTTDVYSVMLTRADDGVTMPTCPITPEIHADTTEFPYPAVTVASKGDAVNMENVSGLATVRLYNAAGQMYTAWEIDEYNVAVSMPSVPGVYLMAVENGGVTRFYKMVVR